MANPYFLAELPIVTSIAVGSIIYGYKQLKESVVSRTEALQERLDKQDDAMTAQNRSLIVIGQKIGSHDESLKDLWSKNGKQDAAISALQQSTTELATLVQLLTDGRIKNAG